MTRDKSLMTITVALGLLQRSYRARADKIVAPLGISSAMAWPLVLIGRHPEGIRPGTLSEELGIEGPSLVRSLNQLVDAGLVLRHEDAVDKRAKILHLTLAGSDISIQIETLLNECRAELFEGVAQEDIDACLRIFCILQKRLGLSGSSSIDANMLTART